MASTPSNTDETVEHQPAYTQTQTPRSAFRLSVLIPVYNERHVVEASVRRVLALQHPLISELEVIIVDDCSKDGTSDVLRRLAAEDSRITLIRHETNKGKGGALRTAIAQASGDVCVVHDADFEYNPADIPSLLVPFAEEGADAVFGSRYLSASYRRALMYRHTLMNKGITTMCNWLTDLHVTDVETCYKAINTTLLKSIPIRSNDFRFEIELTFKLAKRSARVFEVPIRYLPRTYAEGKKIRPRDGMLALAAMAHWTLIDDLYENDQYGTRLISELDKARRFTLWLGEVIRPFVGNQILEIGAGVGSITNQFIPRDLYVAAEVNPNYLTYLRSYALGKPYLHVMELDPGQPEQFRGLESQFDTVLLLNVLEGLDNPAASLAAAYSSLREGGRVIIQVPQGKKRFGTLDTERGRRMRFEAGELRTLLESVGFKLEHMDDFNRMSVPGWNLNSKFLRRKRFSRLQLKTLDMLLPLMRPIDRVWPWKGLSLIAVGVK
ncbi:MAG TPA: glycosyltransferase [Terriglobales bacterium]|nr:glycosyltransferase [Terriglobales bacterium]